MNYEKILFWVQRQTHLEENVIWIHPYSSGEGMLLRLPTGHPTMLWRWLNVIDAESTSQQRRVPSG